MIAVHDPTLLAWFITAAYLVGTILTLAAAGSTTDRRDRIFWIGCAALLMLLGFNKQLDLQGYITTAGRTLAHEEGWFERRRLVQTAFILVLGTVAVAIFAALAVWLRRSARPVKIAALGIVLLITFVLWRAASFHHMDIWVTHEIAGMRSGWWLELSGILVIGLSAVTFRRRNRASLARL